MKAKEILLNKLSKLSPTKLGDVIDTMIEIEDDEKLLSGFKCKEEEIPAIMELVKQMVTEGMDPDNILTNVIGYDYVYVHTNHLDQNHKNMILELVKKEANFYQEFEASVIAYVDPLKAKEFNTLVDTIRKSYEEGLVKLCGEITNYYLSDDKVIAATVDTNDFIGHMLINVVLIEEKKFLFFKYTKKKELEVLEINNDWKNLSLNTYLKKV